MKLSIITINRNNATGLAETLQSVWGSEGTFSDFEHIVIDGASMDGSMEVVEKYREHLAYAISEPDGGIFDAMNKGAALATGEYLMFLNSGDVLLPGVLDKVPFNEMTEDVVYGDVDLVGDNVTNRFVPPEGKDITLAYFLLESLPHQASFTRKALFDSLGGFDRSKRIVSDRKFFFQASQCPQTTFRHLPICIVRFDAHGISSDPKMKLLEAEENRSYLAPVFGEEVVDRLLLGRLFTRTTTLESVKNDSSLARDLLRMTDFVLAFRRTWIGKRIVGCISKTLEKSEQRKLRRAAN